MSWKDRLFYGWVVVAAGFVFNAMVLGTRYSFGIFFKSIESEFNLSRAATSGVFSVYMALCCVIAMLGGWAFDRYGPRRVTLLMGLSTVLSLLLTSQANSSWQLFITYSLLLAIGTGAGYVVVMATVSRWFIKRRGLVMGIAGSGVGVGTVIMAPFAAYLISSFNWRISLGVVGLIAGLGMVSCSRLLKKDLGELGVLPDGVKADSGEVKNQEKRASIKPFRFPIQAFRVRSFWLLWLSWLTWALCFHIVSTHLVPHATDMGVSATEAAVILGLIGMLSIPSRLVMGGVSDRIGRKLSAVICALLQLGAMTFLIWGQDLWMFYAFAIVFGIGYGGLDPPTVAMVGDIFGLRNIGVLTGAIVMGWGVGAAIGPLLAGFLFDISKSYSIAFAVGALAMLITTLSVALIKVEPVGFPGEVRN